MSERTKTDYHQRFERVLKYIDANLDGDLSLERLGDIAAFSRFHFHRQFASLYGIGVGKFVTLKRLKLAAHVLAYRDAAITSLALESGYESLESFSRAFKKHFDVTPSAFSKNPDWSFWLTHFDPDARKGLPDMNDQHCIGDVEIIGFPETRIAALEHQGSPQGVMNTVRKFIAWRKENALPPSQAATFNLLYDNPDEFAPEDYRFGVACEVKAGVAPNDTGVTETSIPAGPCARLRHIGSDALLEQSVSWLYGVWLPQSGRDLRDFPILLQRLALYPDVPEGEAKTDIFLPLTP